MKERLAPLFAKIKETFGLEKNGLLVGLGLFILILVVGTILSLRFSPPTTIVMGTGPEGSAFEKIGQRYKTLMARSGITVKLVPSGGSLENLQRINDPKSRIDVAFVQDGLTQGVEYRKLASLGSIGYEPLRIFYRAPAPITLLSELRGKRVAVGPEGSGTRLLALALLKLNGIEPGGETSILDAAAETAAQQLLDGSIDAVFLMGDSTPIQITRALAQDPTVRLYDFAQADAYVRKIHYLNKLTLPRGSSDLGKDVPPADVALVGPTIELVARRDLHPAIADLLLDAARQIHGNAGTFQRQGEFPSLTERDFPLSDEAVRYAKSGKTFLYRDLPFWLANLVNRLLLVVVPTLVVLIPALKIIPSAYQWQIRLRLYRWYNELLALEGDFLQNPSPERRDALLERLREIEHKADRYKAPASFADQFYALRGHILFVRERIAEKIAPTAGR